MKTTKRALFSSVIALILCFSMLVGTTFAWFTDSVESGVNHIIAGNLDIELYHEDNQVTNTYDKLFEDILWEPGVVAYENITVKNEGTLQLKYQLSVNFDNATPAKNGKTLADALYVAFVEGGFSGDREYAKTLDFAPMASFMQAGQLNVTDHTSDTYGIVIYWLPTDKDNDFNMNNENRDEELSINLGIKLVATQVEGEFDSFGPDYDVDAIYTDAVVTSEAELKEALANGKDDMIIGIKGNVTWTTGAGIGSTPFVGKDSSIKKITLLGLTEDATFTALGSGVGAVGIDGGVVTFKNLKIVDQSVSYAENSWEYGYLEFRGNTVFENCDIVNAIMMEGDSATFKNCTFNSRKVSEYAVWVSEGDATFENCYITGARGIKVHEAYGSKVGTVVIKNNQFIDLTEKPGLAIGDVDEETTVVLQNNTFAGTQAGDQGNYMYETDTAVTIFDFVCADNMVAGYADTNAELKDQLQNNATVILPEGEYTLPSLAGKEGITIIGAADGSTVVGGNTSTGFGGNFGKNTTIKNVTFSGSTNGVRSSYAQGGDTVFENCTFAGDSTYGFHIDQSNGATFTFNNCTFSGFNAFAGDLVKVIFNNCTFLHNGNYGHTNIWSVAEFNKCTFGDKASVGTRGSNAHIFFDGVEESYHHEYIGSAESLFAFAKSVNEGGDRWNGQKVVLVADIDLENALWTPIGQTGAGATQFQGTFDGQGYTIKNLKIDSSAQTGEYYATGLFGWLFNASVKNVKVDTATVVGGAYVGVIAGYIEWEGTTVENCHVTNATVEGKHVSDTRCGDKVGVIVGYAGNPGTPVKNCSATNSTVTAGRDAGQIAGAALTANVIGCSAENVSVTAGSGCTGANINEAIIGRVLG